MKNIIPLLLIIIFLFIKCTNDSIIPTNNLEGKIKTLIQYDGNSDTINKQLYRYEFIYDSIYGTLEKINLSVKSNDMYYNNITTYLLTKENNNKLSFLWYEDGIKRRIFNVYVNNNNQIVSIKEEDTIANIEQNTTYLYRLNNNIDSIYDIDYGGSFISSGTYISNAKYENNNCKSFRLQYATYYPTNTSVDDTMQFYFSQHLNTNMLPYQLPDANAGGSVLRLLSYYLNINGYQAFQPNYNLIDSITCGDYSYKYQYEFLNSRVSKSSKIIYGNGSSLITYNLYEYY